MGWARSEGRCVGRTRRAQATALKERQEARAPERPARVVEAPHFLRVVELPREVVEMVLPLLPACTLLRARVVCRCGA